MFKTKASAREAISAISSRACAIRGEPPKAKTTLAVEFITTRFVILWIKGLFALTLMSSSKPLFPASLSVILSSLLAKFYQFTTRSKGR